MPTRAWNIPKSTLPYVPVTPSTMDGYPFGALDMTDGAQRHQFLAAFGRLNALVTKWNLAITCTFTNTQTDPVSGDMTVTTDNGSGSVLSGSNGLDFGPADLVIPGWDNPHHGFPWTSGSALTLPITEDQLVPQRARIVGPASGAVALAGTIVTTPGGGGSPSTLPITGSAGVNVHFCETFQSIDPDLGPYYTYSYHNAESGYLGMLVIAEMAGFDGSTFELFKATSVASAFPGATPCGTFTLQFPDWIPDGHGAHRTISLACPLYAVNNMGGVGSMVLNVTMTPGECLSWGGIWNNDGTANSSPYR